MNKCYVGLLFNFFIAIPCISTLLLFSSTASALNIQMQAAGQMPPIKLNDNSLKNQALATRNTGEPRLTINKNSEQCPTAYKLYKCKMSGFSISSDLVTQETSPIIISYTGMNYSLKFLMNMSTYLYVLSK